MLAQQTTVLLHRLKMPATAAALDEQRRLPDIISLNFEDRLALLSEREHVTRGNRRLTRLLQLARLRHRASLEDVKVGVKRGLEKGNCCASRPVNQHAHRIILTERSLPKLGARLSSDTASS